MTGPISRVPAQPVDAGILCAHDRPNCTRKSAISTGSTWNIIVCCRPSVAVGHFHPDVIQLHIIPVNSQQLLAQRWPARRRYTVQGHVVMTITPVC